MPPTHRQSPFDENNLNSILSNILTRLDQYERTQETQHAENKSMLQEIRDGFEKRIGSLEKWRWFMGGGLALMGLEIGWWVVLKGGH